MKKASIGMLIILIGVAVCVMGTQWTVRQTVQWQYELLRAAEDENTGADLLLLGTNEGDYANKHEDAKQLLANNASAMTHNVVTLIFCGTDAEDDEFEWKLYAWRHRNGPAEVVAVGTGILGAQDVVLYPHDGSTATTAYWADTLAVTTDYWNSACTATTIGGNSVCKLVFDASGYEWFYVEITEADGTTGIQAGDISVYYSYF